MLRRWKRELHGKTCVDLKGKNLTDEDALAIGELLKTNSTLKELYLWNNNITDVQSIGEGLKTNNTLTTLYLFNNNITDDSGIQSIIDVLKTNNALKTLWLWNNQLSSNMRSQLKAIEQYKREWIKRVSTSERDADTCILCQQNSRTRCDKKEESERNGRKRRENRKKFQIGKSCM